jgi:hypothetical protein
MGFRGKCRSAITSLFHYPSRRKWAYASACRDRSGEGNIFVVKEAETERARLAECDLGLSGQQSPEEINDVSLR